MSREIKFRYVFKRKTDGHIYIIEFNVEALEDKSVSQIKLAELRHGKMLIGLFGTAKATEIIGSYHAVRRIKRLDQRISLDMILKANTMLRNDLWKLVARDQFTGLKDKNGKEIYESDIVRIWADPKHYSGYTGHDYVEAVVWNPERAQYKLTEHEFDDFEFIEVIGNIHENKDLLT